MDTNKNQDQSSLSDGVDPSLTKDVRNLTEAIIENLEDDSVSETEAFELYVQKVRSKMHEDKNIFNSRFINGYQVLIKELKSL